MKITKRALSGFLALVLALGCSVLLPSQQANAITQADIDALKEQSEELGNRIYDTEAKLEELKDEQTRTLAQKALYDEQCSLLAQQVKNTEDQISYYEELMVQAQADLDKALQDEADQRTLMGERIRAMEERGTISYWEILFGASSFRDLLSRLDFIFEIMSYDDDVISEYQRYQKKTIARQQKLDDLKGETEEAKDVLQDQKADMEAKAEEAAAIAKEIEANQEEYQALLDELAAEDAELNNKIAAAEEEYAEQIRRAEEERKRREAEAAAHSQTLGGGSDASGVSLIWPVDSRTITSYYGYRDASATNGVGSTNHRGIDIGSVGYSTPVVASASGVVTVATYSSSAGNYVSVSHGSGVTTVYMHMSYLTVSAGEYVEQGQQLGVTGSTGNSTGPHLHFGITIDGSYVNPLNYLP